MMLSLQRTWPALLFCALALPATGSGAAERHIDIDISEQMLYLYDGGEFLAAYPVSTSKYGAGNQIGSKKTPLGLHYIAAKIGADAPLYTVFDERRQTGTIQEPSSDLEKALITSRILQLQGLERGINSGKGVDTLTRGIYIHGTTAEARIGEPASHGCIRMRNEEVVELFEQVPRLTRVRLRE